jgi:hypothetical protein
MTVAYAPHHAFRTLYDSYTGPGSTAQHLTKLMVRLTERDPLLLVTGADFVIFPGDRRAPIVESFRHSTRGFVELTAVSHLAPGIAWLFRLRELGYENWREDAKRLLETADQVRSINDTRYWEKEVAVEAFQGYEAKIADMVDYACRVSTQFLKTCLADERLMTYDNLRSLARRPSLSLSQLRAEPFVTYPREAGTGLYWQILDICAQAGFRPRVAREVLEPSTIIGLVAAGVGVAIVPDGIQCIRLNGAIYKPLTDIAAYSAVYLARRQDDPNTHLRAFREILAAAGSSRPLQKKPRKRSRESSR